MGRIKIVIKQMKQKGGDKLKIILVSNDNIVEIQMYSYKNVEVEEDN